MSILDYHAKNLCPGVWDQDGVQLTGQFRAVLAELTREFPAGSRSLLVGDATSHYWTEDSDIDVIVLVPADAIEKAQALARTTSARVHTGRRKFNFFVMPDSNEARHLAERFGPIYCPDTVSWHGVAAHDTGELLRPSGLVRRISWLLHKTWLLSEVDNNFDLDNPDWKIEFEAFNDMKALARNETLTELNRRIILADHALEQFLPTLPRGEWKTAAEFEARLNEKGSVPSSKLSKKAKSFIIDIFRRRELYEELQTRHDRLETMERVEIREASMRTALTIDFMAGDWFRTKLELFPLIYIRNIHRDITKMAIGSEDFDADARLVDFELVGEGGIPMLATATLKEVKGYGLKEATDKDFEDLGLIQPTPLV